jgi:hypothetical protein
VRPTPFLFIFALSSKRVNQYNEKLQ